MGSSRKLTPWKLGFGLRVHGRSTMLGKQVGSIKNKKNWPDTLQRLQLACFFLENIRAMLNMLS